MCQLVATCTAHRCFVPTLPIPSPLVAWQQPHDTIQYMLNNRDNKNNNNKTYIYVMRLHISSRGELFDLYICWLTEIVVGFGLECDTNEGEDGIWSNVVDWVRMGRG